MDYGVRNIRVYPVNQYEIDNLYHCAIASCFLVGIPFLIWEVFKFVRKLKKETIFDDGEENL